MAVKSVWKKRTIKAMTMTKKKQHMEEIVRPNTKKIEVRQFHVMK